MITGGGVVITTSLCNGVCENDFSVMARPVGVSSENVSPA